MKSFTRAISNIIKSQPYQTGRYFDKDNIMVLNELGDTFYYDKTTGDCTLRVNGISTVLPTGGEMSDEMLVSLNGQLINQKILLLNFVFEGEIHVTALAATEEWDGDANPNRMFNFAGTKPTLLLDDRYSTNNDVDAVVFYCIEKNGRYFLAKRRFSENFEKEHLLFTIEKELYESPDRISFSFNTEYSGMYYIKKDDPVVTPPGPIACIPTNHTFSEDLMNFNLVNMVDVIYQFYAIVETSKGERFFVRTKSDIDIPQRPITMNIYGEENVPVTAAMIALRFLSWSRLTDTGFNDETREIQYDSTYGLFINSLMYRYNIDIFNEYSLLRDIEGFTINSSVPDQFISDTEQLNLSFNPEPYSFKFTRETTDEREEYGIVNTSGQRCINVIDYINQGNEIVLHSCAKLGLPLDSNLDDVSLINCVDARTHYIFGIQNIYTLSDLSGTIQITDTVTGLSKKYRFNDIHNCFGYNERSGYIRVDFPTYNSAVVSGAEQWVIYLMQTAADFSNLNPLKIIIEMNSPNALFFNNDSNRLDFCLSVEQKFYA